MKKTVNCPTCQKTVAWSKIATFRPFCSERCKLIDLGEWAAENHSIAGEKVYLAADDEQSLDY
ncbi:DNA gyrase inhibitor YacG [Cycloclasticus sp. 44_32_T64]|nr:DNA gyrase inhibitor YacG [Cycloclasticus sp. 44_32_T64]